MFVASLYIHAQNRALNATKDLTRSDLIVLDLLALFNKPTKHSVLLGSIHHDYYTISTRMFQASLNKLVAAKCITKTTIGNNAIYCITLNGKSQLTVFNQVLDGIVKEQIMKYGNGL